MRVETLRSMTAVRLAKITLDATLRTAASALSHPRIGLLVVCGAENRAAGVVSKSDIVRHLTSAGITDAPIAALMSQGIVTCHPEDELYNTWQKMTARNLQNMPVLDAGDKPIGVLDIRDAFKALFDQEEYQERILRDYVEGVGYQ